YSQMTAARAGLLGEFDRPDPAALRRLAKTYLAFGFGREALALIEAFDKEMEDTALLADLALAVEGQQAVADGPLDRARGCGGVAAVLRGASLGFDAPPDGGLRASLFAAFSEMPARQRRLFGPPLSAALLSVGDSAGARRISGIAARAPGDDTPGQSLLAARLDLAAGPDEHSLAVLRRLGLAAQAEAPEALALLVGELVSHGRDVPPEVMSALALAQFENRGTDVGRRLLAIRIRALIAAGSAATAYETLAAALRGAGPVPGESAMAAAVLMAYRPGAASPAEYARRVWRLLPRLGSDEEADAARAAVAAGLTEIGLPNLALAALQPAQGRGRAGVRLAAAKAYLAEGRPRRALGVVAGLPAATAAPVAARALAEMGDPAAALRRLRDTGASGAPALLDFAWQAGDWKTASGVADGPRRALAAFMLSRPGDGVARRRRAGGIAEPGEPPVTLGAMRRQLARSAETRDLVARALAAEAPASK
ncbi:MAG: hypothetical protein ACE5FS_16635, partial [Paracoccaceae bacterium]